MADLVAVSTTCTPKFDDAPALNHECLEKATGNYSVFIESRLNIIVPSAEEFHRDYFYWDNSILRLSTCVSVICSPLILLRTHTRTLWLLDFFRGRATCRAATHSVWIEEHQPTCRWSMSTKSSYFQQNHASELLSNERQEKCTHHQERGDHEHFCLSRAVRLSHLDAAVAASLLLLILRSSTRWLGLS